MVTYVLVLLVPLQELELRPVRYFGECLQRSALNMVCNKSK